MQFPSICIPSIERHITLSKILSIFEKLNLGIISKVVIKKKSKLSSAYIYIEKWNIQGEKGKKFYQKIIDGEEVNLIYEFPWFWKCRANHDIRELKFNKLRDQTQKQKRKINHLNKENWNLKCYARWLATRRGNYHPQTI